MTIHWMICPSCGHRQGMRTEPTSAVACVSCSNSMVRPTWASADADDLSIHYERVNGGVAPTAIGQAHGYC